MKKVTIRVVESMLHPTVSNMGQGSFNPAVYRNLEHIASFVVADMLSRGAGGATVSGESMGYWMDNEAHMVSEKGMDVVTFCDEKVAEALRITAESVKTIGKQDCVLFTIEDMAEVSFI